MTYETTVERVTFLLDFAAPWGVRALVEVWPSGQRQQTVNLSG